MSWKPSTGKIQERKTTNCSGPAPYGGVTKTAAVQANLNATAITALLGQMADMAQDISDLDARVTALEGGG